jgi:hypothetical protein
MSSTSKYIFPATTKGDTFPGTNFTVELNGAPLNLTGYSITLWFRSGSQTGPIVKQLAIGTGITITNAAAGQFSINPFIVDMPVGQTYYDIQFQTGPTIKTYIYGTLEVLQDVTQ